MLNREHRRPGARALTDLVEDAGEVVLRSTRREELRLGDLAVGEPARNEAQHLDLARTQIARPCRSGARQLGGLDQRSSALGELMGIPPTDRPIKVEAITIHRIADGKIAAEWTVRDALGLLQQIGAVPVAA